MHVHDSDRERLDVSSPNVRVSLLKEPSRQDQAEEFRTIQAVSVGLSRTM